MQVFWQQGYEGTSISDLTKVMGINPPSLYAAFGDKERLFLEAVEHYGCEQDQTASSILSEEKTARRAIERVLRWAAEEYTKRCHPPGCMVMTGATNCSAQSAHLQTALARRRADAEAALKARIARGIVEGELPAATDAGALAKFYMSVLQGISIQARDGASRKSLLTTVATAMRAWPGNGDKS